MKAWIHKHPLISFFGLTYAIAFGVTFAYIALKPGQPSERWSLDWFLNAFSPTISALFLSWIIGGRTEVKRLLSGFTRWKVGLRWYFAAAFLVLGPLAFALVYKALGNPVPGLQPGWTLSLILGQLVFQLFSGPLSEEAGWRGFALPRLQEKYNALVSSLILGVIWCWSLLGSLGTRLGLPDFVLVLGLVTARTGLHGPNLTHIFIHSPGKRIIR